MRCKLSDFERGIVKPMFPKDPRGTPAWTTGNPSMVPLGVALGRAVAGSA